MKIALLIDPYMYIEKRDIELLIFSDDHDMVDLTLRHPVQMHVTMAGYRLIKIKEGQVNFKQMTDLHLNDFLLNLVSNKKKNLYAPSDVIFSHHRIINFIERHHEFLFPGQVIKLLIMMRQFRISLNLIIKYKVPFDIEFLTMAVEAENWEVSFYLFNRFES